MGDPTLMSLIGKTVDDPAVVAVFAEHRFTQIFPGHGRPFVAPSIDAMQSALRELADAM